MKDNEIFAANLDERMKEVRISQKQFALAIGVSTPMIYYYTHGEYLPKKKVMNKITKVLGCSDTYLLTKHTPEFLQESQFALNARKIMKEKRYTQSTLAKKTGIDVSDVNKYINQRKRPNQNTIATFAAALDCSVKDLVGDKNLQPIHINKEETTQNEKLGPFSCAEEPDSANINKKNTAKREDVKQSTEIIKTELPQNNDMISIASIYAYAKVEQEKYAKNKELAAKIRNDLLYKLYEEKEKSWINFEARMREVEKRVTNKEEEETDDEQIRAEN